MIIDQQNFDNILVDQKNEILNLINDSTSVLHDGDWGKGVKGAQAALAMLKLVKPLWLASDYGYKVDELVHRMESEVKCIFRGLPNQATRKIDDCKTILGVCRVLSGWKK